jgi:hypothetical protein
LGHTRARTRAVLVLASAAGALIGCGGRETLITRHPGWNYESYPRLLVVAGTADHPALQPAAQVLASDFESRLARSGVFAVLSGDQRALAVKEQDFSRLADVADPSTIIPAGRIKSAQAIVVAKITAFEPLQEQVPIQIPQYAVNQQGQLYVAGYNTIWIFRHGAALRGRVRVIDTATCTVVFDYSTPQPVVVQTEQYNSPPPRSPLALASDAAASLALYLYASVAPVTVRVKLNDDMLIVARSYYDGEYEGVNAISGSGSFLVAVRRLPDACDRNPFLVAIDAEGGREHLFAQEFVWSAANGASARGEQIEVPIGVLQRAGVSRFVAKLYSRGDEKPILTRGFTYR